MYELLVDRVLDVVSEGCPHAKECDARECKDCNCADKAQRVVEMARDSILREALETIAGHRIRTDLQSDRDIAREALKPIIR